MKPRDVLADHVHAGRPDRLKSLVIGAVADAGDVIQKCIKPDIDRLLLVEWNLDPPGKSLARDGDVLELGLDQIDHLVSPALGLDEVRMSRVMLKQAIAKCRKPEEVI